ncbi:carbon-nitrogen hydrolase family protein [Methylobacterium sp. NEAU 140]|uniref:carbon-nitrogen hydrolase family protein n=1 Tax=Methylobacterium sp. NEAU 140 TaxID=3064945 RepID=UPI002733AF42|nr:carbon-nitrogen hydrolase family protein [Methylobacterium sp. NEAU 140]MDP4026592.1 carbon-nitrogen hydrolase family protein [Methylobacterium sp. NEAU 140]
MSRIIKVASAQTGSVESDDMSSMVPKAVSMIRDAGERGVNILTFCELFLSPFFPNQLIEDNDRFFTSVDSEPMTAIRDAAKAARVALVLPFGERANTGNYNSTLVTDASGKVLGTYRKTHIPAYFPNSKSGGTGSYEKFYFTPGGALPVFDVDGVKIGVQICNDRLYPEPSRVLTLGGAEIIFMPIAFSVYSDPEHRNSIWELALRSRAFENGVYVVACNKVGQEGVRKHLGRSMIVDPRGMIVAEASNEREELLVREIDVGQVSAMRKKFPWWRDRRPDLYGAVASH